MEDFATESSAPIPEETAPTDPTPVDSPAQAREVLDRLEEKVGPIHSGESGSGLQGDFVRDVPGAPEPPD